MVVGFDLEVVGGDEALTVASDATDDSVDGHIQLSNGLSRDGSTCPYLKLYDVGVDAAEALQRGDLGAEGVFHHVAGRNEFLVDDGVDADVLRDVNVVDVLDKGDGLLHAERLGLQAGQDVGLGVVGDGNEGVHVPGRGYGRRR